MARTLNEDGLEVEETSFEDQEEKGSLPQKPIGNIGKYPSVAMTDTVSDELQNQLDVLDAQFAAGELGITDYVKQRSVVDRQIIYYQINEANNQKAHTDWMAAQDEFMVENPHYTENKILFEALVRGVKDVQEDIRSKGLTTAQVLGAADYLVRDSFGLLAQVSAIKDLQDNVQSRGFSPLQILKAIENLERDSFDKDETDEAGIEQKIWS